MPDLAEFLLARIAEDKASWISCAMADWCPQMDEARVLAECEAKRQIVESLAANLDARPNRRVGRGLRWQASATLRLLSLPYVGDPHYRDEWRP